MLRTYDKVASVVYAAELWPITREAAETMADQTGC